MFVTGAHGFKGSWLCILLSMLGARVYGYGLINSASAELHRIVRNVVDQVEFTEGDIRDSEKLSDALKEFDPDVVFHMAAEPLVSTGYEMPVTVFDVNMMGTVHLLEALRGCNKVRSIVNVTTDKVYANADDNSLFTENDSLGGDDPYSASKACSELITRSYAKSFFSAKIGLCTARAGNVIGAGDYSENRLIPDIIRAAQTKTTMKLRSPDSVRPWQHVVDPIIGYVMLAAKAHEEPHKFSQPFNFGPGHQQIFTVSELLEIIQKLGLIELDFEVVENSIREKANLSLLSDRAKSMLNWENKGDIEDDLRSIIEGYNLISDPERFIKHCRVVINTKLRKN